MIKIKHSIRGEILRIRAIWVKSSREYDNMIKRAQVEHKEREYRENLQDKGFYLSKCISIDTYEASLNEMVTIHEYRFTQKEPKRTLYGMP